MIGVISIVIIKIWLKIEKIKNKEDIKVAQKARFKKKNSPKTQWCTQQNRNFSNECNEVGAYFEHLVFNLLNIYYNL